MTALLSTLLIALLVQVVAAPSSPASATFAETTGSVAHTWTNYTNAGGTEGPEIPSNDTVQIACRLTGFAVADGNTWWYQIAASPWNYNYYVSADAFYNNGATSGSLHGTPFFDPSVPVCGQGAGYEETTGSVANTWSDYSNAGGSQGPEIGLHQTVAVTCKVSGFQVADGNTWWYQIASSPWNNAFYVSADPFYNNGSTTGSLPGTPFVDPAVPTCQGPVASGYSETTGSVANTWSDYADAGGTEGPQIGSHETVAIACKVSGFRVADGNTWWYQIASAPWNQAFYVSADPFYNDGATSGSLIGTPYVDLSVPNCSDGPRDGTETAGPDGAGTFADYSDAGGAQYNRISGDTSVYVACRVTGFEVSDGDTWWYEISSSPWSDAYYASADDFWNGPTSGSFAESPLVDYSVPICTNNAEAPAYGTAAGSSQAAVHSPGCITADPVDCASGDFWQTFTDVSIPGRGAGLNLARTYNDQAAATAGVFGYGWSSSYDQHLTLNADGSITATLADGSQMIATPNGSGGFTVPSWADSTLQVNGDGTYTLTRQATQLLNFSASGLLLSIRDTNGDQTTLSYNSSGQLSAVSDSAGRVLTVNVGNNGFVSSVVDPMGRTTTYGYDSVGNLTSFTDPLGHTWTFTYDGGHQMLTMTDPGGGVVTNTFSGDRVSTQTDPAGLVTTFAYAGDNFSSLGGTTTITDPHGNVKFEQYANGLLMKLTKGYGTANQATWTYAYDPATYGVTSVTDPNGNITTSTYDSTGQVLTTTDPLGNTATYTYNEFQEPVQSTTPALETTSRTYDGDGNLLTVTDPLDNETTYTYGDSNHPGDITAVAEPDGGVTRFTYDADGDVASRSVSPSNGVTNTTTYSYDADGEVVCEASPDAVASGTSCPGPGAPAAGDTTATAYNADGDVTSVTDPNGETTTYRYDANGNNVQVTDADGNVTTSTYDADNRIVTATNGDNGSVTSTTTYAYDLAPGSGNCQAAPNATYCTTTTDPNGGVTVSYYDALDNKIQITQQPVGEATEYSYDLDGNDVAKTDAEGRTTTYSYDGDNHVTSISYSDGTTPDVNYTYDADGQRASMSDGTGVTSYTYDADGRVTSVTDGAGATVGYSYDGDGDLTTLTYPNNKSVTRSYNGADQLATVTDWLGNTTSFNYDPDGNVTSTAYPNGDTVKASYDADDAMKSTSVLSGGTSLAALAYTRDPDGLITQESDSGALSGTTNYAYNAQDELTAAGNATYAYDPGGNLIDNGATTQTFNTADQLTATTTGPATTNYAYDADGERTNITDPSGAATSYAYDQAGRLSSVTEHVPAPGVSAVSPANGSTAGGTTVTIAGSGLSAATAVDFGALAAKSFTVVSDTEITATAPPGIAGSVDLTVTTAGGTSALTASDQFTYVAAPTISGLTPASGSYKGGTQVTISGSGFSAVSSVDFGTVPAKSFTVVSATQITATSPPHATGTRNVFVATTGGESAAGAADDFTFVAAPTVSGLLPMAGSHQGGTTVTITGSGFSGVTAVDFGTVAAKTFTVVSTTEITAVSPPHAVGTPNLRVTASGATSGAVPADEFTFVAAPTVSGVSPASGARQGGTTVTVAGSGFRGATAVDFGTATAKTFTVDSATELTAVSPAHAAATANIRVVGVGGTSSVVTADQFTYTRAAPAARSVTRTRSAVRSHALSMTTVDVASYTYNGDGLRMTEVAASGTTSFAWDSTPSVPEVLTDGSSYFIYGPGGLPIEQIDASSNPSYFFHDDDGTTRALLSGDGTIGATFTYNAFGAETSTTGTLKTALLYAQSYRDPATGLLYLINRYYDPATAQFLSVDPLVSDTAQPYEYAADNPLDQNDPNGLFCVLGHNPNGSCRGSNVGNDAHAVVIGLGVVALAATVAAAAIPAGATAAVLTGVAAVASGVAAAYGVEQVIDTCVSRGFGSSSCSSASLSNDFQTLLSFVPGKAGEILEVLSLLHLSGQADSSGSGGTASRPSSSGPQVGGSC